MSAIEQAVRMLIEQSRALRESHTIGGDWRGDPSQAEYELIRATAHAALAELNAMHTRLEVERSACAQIARDEIIDTERMDPNDSRLAQDFEAGNRVAERIERLILARGQS